MDLRKLVYFMTVAEEHSISAAAKRLHMTQPPLSQAVLAFEREVGTQLLRRHSRGIEPTDAGLRMVEHGKNLLQLTDRITDEVQRLGEGKSGKLVIASVPTFTWSHLPALLQSFEVSVPDIELELDDPDPVGVMRMVQDGSAHIGFVATSDPDTLAAVYPNLQIQCVATLPLSLVVSQKLLPENSGEKLTAAPLSAFADMTWFVPKDIPRVPSLAEIVRTLWRETGVFPPSFQYVSTLQTALPFVAAGMGVSILPEALTAPTIAGISPWPTTTAIPPLYFVAVHATRAPVSAILNTFLEVMNEYFEDGGPQKNAAQPEDGQSAAPVA